VLNIANNSDLPINENIKIPEVMVKGPNGEKMGLKKKTMFLIIALITLFHWMMVILWFVFKKISVEKGYTTDNKEFVECKYPHSKNISSLFNFVILGFEFVLSYSIRRVEKKYKEALIVPAYAYIIYMTLMYIINSQKVINVVIRDYFDIAGTVANTIVSIYDLFIIKFIEIFTIKQIKSSRKRNSHKV